MEWFKTIFEGCPATLTHHPIRFYLCNSFLYCGPIFQVSATFAASLVTSPALGAYLEHVYSENFVIWLATAIALLDVIFIMVAVPESLPEKLRPASWGSQISWEKADPFGVEL